MTQLEVAFNICQCSDIPYLYRVKESTESLYVLKGGQGGQGDLSGLFMCWWEVGPAKNTPGLVFHLARLSSVLICVADKLIRP